MTFDQILAELNNRKFKPIYWLEGEEPYFIDQLTDYLATHVLTPDEQAFNQETVYGKEINPDQLVEMARQFPMMSEYRVVIVKEAQGIDARKWAALEAYFENPTASTVFVVAHKYKKVDKRKKWFKSVAKNGVVFESKKLYENQLPNWISDYLRARSYDITPKASILVSEYLGNDLGKVANELGKLQVNLPEGHKINEHDIEKNIGISKDFNHFELQKALAHRNFEKANRIVLYFAQNPKSHPLVVTLAILANFFGKTMCIYFEKDRSKQNLMRQLRVHSFALDDYLAASQNYPGSKVVENIGLLREYDLMSKGVDTGQVSDGELLKELVYKLMH